MTVTIEIECVNAAFTNESTGESDPRWEIARILRMLAAYVEEDGPERCMIRDGYGNTVGTLETS